MRLLKHKSPSAGRAIDLTPFKHTVIIDAMNSKVILCAIIMTLSCALCLTPARADDIKLQSGDLNFLQEQKAICVKYIYDGMKVDDKTEDEFINFQVTEQNKGGPGKGADWLDHWKNDRASRYQPLFEERINDAVRKRSVEFSPKATGAKYTLIMQVVSVHPGWAGWGLIHDSSRMDVQATFVETAQPANVLAVISLKKVGGNGFDYNVFGRVSDALGNCGKQLGHFLLDKKAFKK
jgi:hypothetical protein